MNRRWSLSVSGWAGLARVAIGDAAISKAARSFSSGTRASLGEEKANRQGSPNLKADEDESGETKTALDQGSPDDSVAFGRISRF